MIGLRSLQQEETAMAADPSAEVRVRTVRAREDDFVENVVGLAGGAARLGLALFKLPLSLLPRETQQHTLNAFRELSYAFATLPRDFADIAGVEIERWAREAENPPLTARPRARANFRAVEARATPIEIETQTGASFEIETQTLISSARAGAATAFSSGSSFAAGAVSSGVSITYIEFDPPGRDLDGEYVRIKNETDAPVDLSGWTLRDSGPHAYTFPAFVLAPGAEIQLWTKAGVDDATNLYWGDNSPVWNNSGDTATLLNRDGAQVSSYTYTGTRKR
jgi:hypothetical protein